MFSPLLWRLVGRSGSFLLAGLSVALLVGCSTLSDGSAASTSGGEPITLKVTVTPGALTALPVTVGVDMGYFEKNGLTPEEVSSASGTTNTQLLASGQLDVAALDISGTVLANQAGADLAIAAGMATRFPAALVCRPDLEVTKGFPAGVKDIASRDLSIGITGAGSGSDTYSRALYAGADLDPTTINEVALGGLPQMTAALQAKQIDCAMVFQPVQTQIADDVIVDVEGGDGPALINDAAFSVLAVSQSRAGDNPEMISRLQSSEKEITDLLSDPDNAETVADGVAASYPDVPREQLVSILKGLAPTFVDGYAISEEQFDNTLDMYNAAYGEDLSISHSELVLPYTGDGQ